MRVAILTFSQTNNYGATLQCYALNKYIQSLGCETIIINLPLDDGSRRPVAAVNEGKKRPSRGVLGSIIHEFKHLFRRKRKQVPIPQVVLKPYECRYVLSEEQKLVEQKYSQENMKFFDEFRAKYLPNITREYFTEDDFRANYPDADVFVVGSDQVWNTRITGWQYPLFFLSFVKDDNRKISYAPCMGGDENIVFSPEQMDRIKALLSRFSSISVRNKIGRNILMKNFRVGAQQVLDPTFLLDSYDDLLLDSDLSAQGCLWCDKYIVNDDWIEVAKTIADQEGLKLRLDRTLIKIQDLPFSPLCSVSDWLQLVRTSDFVFTDSFHGTIFCILFKKQFITTPSYKGGEGRMLDLLSQLGLENRFFYSPESVLSNRDSWQTPIDYAMVYEKLNVLRKESKDYLYKALFS